MFSDTQKTTPCSHKNFTRKQAFTSTFTKVVLRGPESLNVPFTYKFSYVWATYSKVQRLHTLHDLVNKWQ